VVLIHELSGMSPECVTFARHLIDSKFHVYLPLLYGDPAKSSNILNPLQVCISREFVLFTGGKSSPVTDWVRALCARISHDNNDSKIGVIGMCLTGSFVLACVAEPSVGAGVMSQPALPLHIPFCKDNGAQIGASAIEMATAKAFQTPLLALRFKGDKRAPRSALTRLHSGLADAEGLSWSHRPQGIPKPTPFSPMSGSITPRPRSTPQ
jgi:dienelactone hydrolase